MSWIMWAHVVIRLHERYHKYSLWSLKPFAAATLTHLAMSTPQTGTNLCGKQFRAMETRLHLPGCVPCAVPSVRHCKGAVQPCPVWHRNLLHQHQGHKPSTAGVQASARACWGTAITKYPWKTNLEQVQQMS